WNRYVVLDGASRTSALRSLGVRDILVQIVDYHSPDVRLDSWHHLLLDADPDELRSAIAGIPGLAVEEMDENTARERLERRELVCYVLFADGRVEGVISGADQYAQTRSLSLLTRMYQTRGELYRVSTTDLEELAAEHHRLSAVVVFPRYRPNEILRLAMNGAKVPMGITRHIIPGRALRVNLPLEVLEKEEPLADKNRWLDDWLKNKIQSRSVRYYQEPVFLFDE
ncbi:MAG: hypothetical protein ACM3JD_01130, partial [Rudaea sp.]